jgi:hypothetical protein
MPPRVGAGQLWLVLAAAAWLLSLLMQSAAPLLASAGAALPGGGASRAGAAQALLHARNGRRVVLLRMPRTGAGALCRLAADNGEAVLPGCEAAFGAKATRALRGGRPVEQCTALRTQPLGFFAVDEGIPNDPWLDAGAIYAAALREPRARLVSELLELQHRASQHLWVRFWAHEARAGNVRLTRRCSFHRRARALGRRSWRAWASTPAGRRRRWRRWSWRPRGRRGTGRRKRFGTTPQCGPSPAQRRAPRRTGASPRRICELQWCAFTLYRSFCAAWLTTALLRVAASVFWSRLTWCW